MDKFFYQFYFNNPRESHLFARFLMHELDKYLEIHILPLPSGKYQVTSKCFFQLSVDDFFHLGVKFYSFKIENGFIY